MRRIRLLFVVVCLALLAMSCNKKHYNLGNVSGANMEGEVLLPLASGSYTVEDLMKRFQIDSLIAFQPSGEMSYNYQYEHLKALDADKMLHFDDYETSYTWNLDLSWIPQWLLPIDTVFHYNETIHLETEHLNVLYASLKRGNITGVVSNFDQLAQINHLTIRFLELKDANGQPLEFGLSQGSGTMEMGVENCFYESNEANVIHVELDVDFTMTEPPAHAVDLYFEVSLKDMAIQEMRGTVDNYASESRIDTTFSLFPDNISGLLEINGANMRVKERNGFALPARLVVDTALVSGEGMTPFSIFNTMPLSIDLPFSNGYVEVFDQNLTGWLTPSDNMVTATSSFIVNPDGVNDIVTVYDTCSLDVKVDVEIPLAFQADEIRYVDTVEMKLSEIEYPEWVKSLTLELTFVSTMPFNFNGQFYMFDSQTQTVNDELLDEPVALAASYDGKPVTTTVRIVITEERLNEVMQSDSIIMEYIVDTESHDIILNAKQSLQFNVKARVEYDGVVEFENE